MADSCPTVEVLADLAALPADDPRRRHVQDCPRCRARLLDYQDFLAGGAPVSAASLEDALDRLDAALRDATADPGPAPRSRAAKRCRCARSGARRWPWPPSSCWPWP
ncbi:MAG: hypothetical protein H6694_04950 [Candidatus Latescibacteria bacterium]|nr:hypothetical protein [Candidatus Latescibacterota bacterium]